MAAGRKTGGRQKGTPNRPKAAAAISLRGPRKRAGEADGPAFPRYRIVPTEKLIAYENNPRTHSDAQIAKLVASIRGFGFTNPILTDGRRGVVAGHGRLLAAQKLAMETVPTLELSHLTPAQRRAYVIADNRLALDAGWDDDLLALELGDLRDLGFDLQVTGFDGYELDAMFNEPEDLPPGANDSGSMDTKKQTTCPKCGHVFALVAKA